MKSSDVYDPLEMISWEDWQKQEKILGDISNMLKSWEENNISNENFIVECSKKFRDALVECYGKKLEVKETKSIKASKAYYRRGRWE